ncbi:hypothetical protein D3C74_461910 [compost metagenome]
MLQQTGMQHLMQRSPEDLLHRCTELRLECAARYPFTHPQTHHHEILHSLLFGDFERVQTGQAAA